jgi:hypothetical protein
MCHRIGRRAAFLTVAGLSLVTVGSIPNALAAPEKKAGATRWEISGSRIIGCCCGSPCPCRINKPPYHSHGCDAITAVRIDKGKIGETRMDGVSFAIVGRGFAENPEVNWAYLYVSDTVSDEQVKALQWFLEEDSKSFGLKAEHLVGKFLGMRKVPLRYEVSSDKREYSAISPGLFEFRTRSIILPGRTKPAVSTGIFDAFGDRFIHAESITHVYNDSQIDRKWDLTGRQCNQAEFRLTSAMAAKGGLGWGCWSAHKAFGSGEKYQEHLGNHPEK